MPFDAQAHEEAHVAVLAPASTSHLPIQPDMQTERALDETLVAIGDTGAQMSMSDTTHELPQQDQRPRTALLIVCSAVLAITLVVMLGDVGQHLGRRLQGLVGPGHRTQATATTHPTASATAFPTPTAMPGFQVYVDSTENFVVQYPLTWTKSEANPGVEFDNDPNTLNYVVQVLTPGIGAGGQAGDHNSAAFWVDYELGKLAQKWGTSYSQEPGPAPAEMINDVTWQTGAAQLSEAGTNIRVQVFATVHNGKPYIVNELAYDDKFQSGASAYFTPMLQTFTFLPTTP